MELAVVGSSDFVLGFKLAGVRKTYAVREDELEQKINEVLQDKSVGILVLHNEDINKISSLLKTKIDECLEPIVIPIGKEEFTDLREKVRRAIGIDLYKEK